MEISQMIFEDVTCGGKLMHKVVPRSNLLKDMITITTTPTPTIGRRRGGGGELVSITSVLVSP